MTRIHEYDVVQNSVLGALLLWAFVSEYYKTKGESEGPKFQHMMIVLPILFNRSFVETIYRKNFKGGLYNALNEDMALFIGLQNRMEAMSVLTFRSINVCSCAKNILLDKDRYEFIPVRSKIQDFKDNESIHKMLAAARRLGYWFATNDLNQLCGLLKVRF
jgi:hypothetical protein